MTVADAGAVGTAVADAEPEVVGAGATETLSITPPPIDEWRLLLTNANASVAEKKIAAATPVDFDRKFEEPVAPNKLPEAPEPKAAPMSAPLPCCSNTRPIIVKAAST